MKSRAPQSGEDRLIAHHFRPLARHPGSFALDDDAAAITPPSGCDVVVTTDALIAGVHFFADDPPAAVGSKALRVNLSDLAAKGARPTVYFMTLALGPAVDEGWIESFARGLAADQEEFGISLAGGDTTDVTRNQGGLG